MTQEHIAGLWPCPGCGADNDAALAACPRCQRTRHSEPAQPDPEVWLPELTAWAIVAICFLFSPVGGFLFVAVALPAVMRLFAVTNDAYRLQPRPPILWGTRFLAVFVAAIILVVGLALFVGVCFPVGVLVLTGPHLEGAIVLPFVVGIAAAAGAMYGLVRAMFDRSPWLAPSEPELSERLLLALRQKFGEAGGSLAIEIQNRDATRIRAVLDAVESAQNLDELRKLL